MTRSRASAAVALTAALAVFLAACGDDDDTASEPDATEAAGPETTPAATEPAVDTTASAADTSAPAEGGDFCEAGPAVDEVLAAEEPDPAAVDEALNAAEAAAPAELEGAIGTAAAAVREVLQTGDFAALESPEATQALSDINAYYVSDCGYNALNLTAVNYAFQGVPATAPAGGTVVSLSNEGTELHEAVLFRINDDVTESIEEILALGEEEGQAMVTQAGAAFAVPGATGSSSMTLEPGRYAVVCFIPVGLTPEAAAEAEASGTEPEGAPHFTEGMVTEFTVE
jgi:hypothetical protein